MFGLELCIRDGSYFGFREFFFFYKGFYEREVGTVLEKV